MYHGHNPLGPFQPDTCRVTFHYAYALGIQDPPTPCDAHAERRQRVFARKHHRGGGLRAVGNCPRCRRRMLSDKLRMRLPLQLQPIRPGTFRDSWYPGAAA
jgi:hypothetical protein